MIVTMIESSKSAVSYLIVKLMIVMTMIESSKSAKPYLTPNQHCCVKHKTTSSAIKYNTNANTVGTIHLIAQYRNLLQITFPLGCGRVVPHIKQYPVQ